MDDNSLFINIEAIDDASEVLAGVSDAATEMADQIAGAAQEMNSSLETIGTSALDMSTEADAAFSAFSDGITEMGQSALASMNELDAVMGADAESISEDAIAIGTSWEEAAQMVLGANEEIDSSNKKTMGSQAGLAAALLLVSQYLKQAASAVEDEIEAAYKATGQWNQSTLELNQTLQNTGSSIPMDELTAFTKQMQSSTLFQQEDVLQSENLVMTHKDLQSSYQQVISLSADLATKMAQATGGTANLGNATRLLTNAFSDPVSAMSRLINQAGVDIPYAMQQAIEKTAKAGDTSAAAALLMQELNKQIGGLAVASAQASGTGMQKLSNDFESMQQNMPGVTEAMDDLATILDNILKPLAEFVNDNPKLTALLLITTAAVLALAAAFTGVLALAILFFIGIAAGISGTMIALGVAIAAVIAAVIALAVAFVLNWDNIKAAAADLWDDFRVGFGSLMNWLTNLFEDTYNKIMGWINSIINSVKSIGSTISGGVSGAFGAVGGAISNLIPHFAAGGIVNGPTMALVGESGPEAIIPLNMLGGGSGASSLPSGLAGMGGITVYVTGQVLTTESQAKTLGDMIAKQINRQIRTSTFK